jgi:transcriptional regulator
MYLPAHFEENRREVLDALIAAQPFGTIVTNGPNGLDANHIPFEFEPERGPFGTLRAHVARSNPLWREAPASPETLVIFQGPTAYISPTWYPSKADTHKAVPTWNYMVVHAHGRIVVHDDENYVRGVVARLTRKMEAGESTPWKMGDAPADYLTQMLGAIVGLEIEVTKLVGKWKLSQNRTEADIRGAAGALAERETDEQRAVSQAMLDAMPQK